MIGFKQEYDKDLSGSKHLYYIDKNDVVIISDDEKEKVIRYLRHSDLIISKTFALFDGTNYIGPYMIFSDGEWIWPNYLYYFIQKEKHIAKEFLNYIKEKNYLATNLAKQKRKEVTIFLEKEMLGM